MLWKVQQVFTEYPLPLDPPTDLVSNSAYLPLVLTLENSMSCIRVEIARTVQGGATLPAPVGGKDASYSCTDRSGEIHGGVYGPVDTSSPMWSANYAQKGDTTVTQQDVTDVER
jgi:hypothetical protein